MNIKRGLRATSVEGALCIKNKNKIIVILLNVEVKKRIILSAHSMLVRLENDLSTRFPYADCHAATER